MNFGDLIQSFDDEHYRQKEQLLSVKDIPRPTLGAADAVKFLSTSKRKNVHHAVTPKLRLAVVSEWNHFTSVSLRIFPRYCQLS